MLEKFLRKSRRKIDFPLDFCNNISAISDCPPKESIPLEDKTIFTTIFHISLAGMVLCPSLKPMHLNKE